MFFGKKGDAGVGVIFIIVVIVLFLMWVVTYSQRECNSNEDCSKDSYCGSDFSCHQYPNIVQQKVAAADYTVVNDGTLEKLYQDINKILN